MRLTDILLLKLVELILLVCFGPKAEFTRQVHVAFIGMILTSWLTCVATTGPYSPPNNFREEIMKGSYQEDKLVRYLFSNYSKYSKPTFSENETIVVQMRLFFFKIHDIVEKDELIETTARLQFHWKDKRFNWKEKEFGALKEISLPANLVWLPNIELFNSATDFYTLTQDTRFSVKIHSDGSFWWHPTGNFATRCQLQLRYFPFDHQTCEYIFESSLLTAEKMQLIIRRNKPAIDFLHYIKSGKYELLGAGGKNYIRNVSKSTAFSGVAFHVKFRRKKTFYVLNIILPLIVLAVLQLTTFFLPADDINRVQQSTTVLLAIVVFQTIAIQELPRISDSVPLLCVYVGIITLLSALVIAESIVVGGMLRCTRSMPIWLRYFFAVDDRRHTAATNAKRRAKRAAANETVSGQAGHVGGVTSTGEDMSNAESQTRPVSFKNRTGQKFNAKSESNATSARNLPVVGFSAAPAIAEVTDDNAESMLLEEAVWVRQQQERVARMSTKSRRRRAQRHLTQLTESPELSVIRREWKRLAMALDWVMFVICTVIVGFTPVIMFVWMPLCEPDKIFSEYI